MGFYWSSVLIVLYFKINELSNGISDVQMSGPHVLENGRQQHVDLSCSFMASRLEEEQLDIKWYFENEEEPFLQWVPSSKRPPQTIGPRFRSRVETSHVRVNVTNDTFRVEQVIRVIQPSILTSGVYTCKVATFTSEQITSHNLLIFEPGAGPFLTYKMSPSPSLDKISVICSVKQVFPEPKLSLSCYSEPEYEWSDEGSRVPGDTSTTTVRRGMMYDMSVLTTLSSSLPPQTVFSCVMEIPGTQYSLVKRTMYNGDPDIARARRVSGSVALNPFLTLVTAIGVTLSLSFIYL